MPPSLLQSTSNVSAARLLEDSRQIVHELTGESTDAMSNEELVQTLQRRLRELETLETMRDTPSLERAFIEPLIQTLSGWRLH